MNTEIPKQELFDNLETHIKVLGDAMVEKQHQLLSTAILPPDTILQIHKKMTDLGAAVSWLMNVKVSQFKEFLPRIADATGRPAGKMINGQP